MQQDCTNANTWRPIEYQSQMFSSSESNWDIHLKEFAAVKMVFTKFRFFVKGVRLTLFVNQLPIVQIFQAYGTTKTPVDPRIQRWIAKLLCYNFDVIHISEATNYVADHMSQNPTFFQSPGSISIVGAVNVVKVPQEWIEDFHQAYLDDPAFSTVFKLLYHLETTNTELPDYTLDPKTRLLYLQERLCISHIVTFAIFCTCNTSPSLAVISANNGFYKILNPTITSRR